MGIFFRLALGIYLRHNNKGVCLMGIADSMKKAAFSTAFSYIGKNPEENARS